MITNSDNRNASESCNKSLTLVAQDSDGPVHLVYVALNAKRN